MICGDLKVFESHFSEGLPDIKLISSSTRKHLCPNQVKKKKKSIAVLGIVDYVSCHLERKSFSAACHCAAAAAEELQCLLMYTSSSDGTTTLSNRGAERRKERRESRGGGSVWENRDARSAACNHIEMLHVALVIQACPCCRGDSHMPPLASSSGAAR